MRATTSATNFTSTSASDYILSEGISSSGSHTLGVHALNGVVNLAGNTTFFIWCFALADDGVSSYKSGSILIYGLNK
jgi:hypothetical protein